MAVNKHVKWKGHETYRDADEVNQTSICARPGDVVEVSEACAERLVSGAKPATDVEGVFVEVEQQGWLGEGPERKIKWVEIKRAAAPAVDPSKVVDPNKATENK